MWTLITNNFCSTTFEFFRFGVKVGKNTKNLEKCSIFQVFFKISSQNLNVLSFFEASCETESEQEGDQKPQL
jgi:hypothetical protein